MLLRGFGASTFSWREAVAPLAERGRVIAFDRPAFGLTERILRGDWNPDEWPGGSPYTPEAQADLSIALLDALEIDEAVLVGHSAGGTVAMLAASAIHRECRPSCWRMPPSTLAAVRRALFCPC